MARKSENDESRESGKVKKDRQKMQIIEEVDAGITEEVESVKNRKRKSLEEDPAESTTSKENAQPKKKKGHKKSQPGNEEPPETSDDVQPKQKKSHKKSAPEDEEPSEASDNVQPEKKKDHKKSQPKTSDEVSETAKPKKSRPKKTVEEVENTESSEEIATPSTSNNSKSSKKRSHSNSETPEEPPRKIPSLSFIDFIRDFELNGKDKLQKLKGKPDVAKIVKSIPEMEQYYDFCSQPTFNSDFNALFSTSVTRKHITMDFVVAAINRYLYDGASVEDCVDFPKPPISPVNAYVSEQRNANHSSLHEYAQLRKKFSSDEVDHKPYFDKYHDGCEKYIEELQQYMINNSETLLESHIAHINSIIAKTSTNINSKDFGKIKSKAKVASPKSGKKKVKKTAFDWYKDAFPNKYADRDEETRERKLRKKFDKLEEDERQVYENIAAMNS